MGLDLGLERAGIHARLACEFDKWCQQTIHANRPDLPVIGDLQDHDAASIRAAAGLSGSDPIDVVHGGPPCQAFSTAGGRRGFEDERGNVFLYYIKIAMELRPKYLIIENVRGLLSAPLKHRPHNFRGSDFPPLSGDEKPGGALKLILHLLRESGYQVSFNLYNSANFGTPQIRERVVLICTKGEKVQYLSPTHSDDEEFGLLPWRTFREAVQGLPQRQHHLEFPVDRLKYYKLLRPGQYWKHLPEKLQREALGNSYFAGGGKTGFYRRLAWDRPSPTLVTHPAMPATDLAHPTRNRPLSIEEYRRLQQFPDDWIVCGSLIQQYKQVGNAVPVGLGEAVGQIIRAHEEGIELPIPPNFRFSRYRHTSDYEWALANGVGATSRVRKTSPQQLRLI
jgi:DNA (cytosine-5)-methyltransferase 1